MTAVRIGRLLVASVVTVAGLAGCSSSAPRGAAATPSSPGSVLASADFAGSRYQKLTTLTEAQLCGTMSTAEASRILGVSSTAGVLAVQPECVWVAAGGGRELDVWIYTNFDWQGLQTIATGAKIEIERLTVAGRPAYAIGSDGLVPPEVVVAAGGDHDPAVRFRAPTVAQAKTLATLVMPRVMALVP